MTLSLDDFFKIPRRKRPRQENDYWSFEPNFFDRKIENDVYNELKPHLGGIHKRKSCKLMECPETEEIKVLESTQSVNPNYNYEKIKSASWKDCPTLLKIKEKLEEFAKCKFDYVLAHEYPDGDAIIAWHFDAEAMNSVIASVSFFATRDFVINPIGDKSLKSPDAVRIPLESGDTLLMKVGMQQKFWHCVPTQHKVKQKRINLTFRQLEQPKKE